MIWSHWLDNPNLVLIKMGQQDLTLSVGFVDLTIYVPIRDFIPPEDYGVSPCGKVDTMLNTDYFVSNENNDTMMTGSEDFEQRLVRGLRSYVIIRL